MNRREVRTTKVSIPAHWIPCIANDEPLIDPDEGEEEALEAFCRKFWCVSPIEGEEPYFGVSNWFPKFGCDLQDCIAEYNDEATSR